MTRPDPQAVLGHVRQRRSARPARPPVIGAPRSRISPPQRPADAGERVEQLRLAVAGDAGDADDLAGADVEADALDPRHALVARDHEVAHLEHRLARLRRRLLDPQQHLAADHQLGQLLLAWSPRSGGAPPSRPARITLTWSVTAMISRSLWVIRTTVRPCALQVAQDAEEMVGLLRREHAGRLVEDQDVGAAEQRLEDLDPLLHAHRQARDRRVEVDLEAVVALERRDLGAGARGAAGEREAALGAQQQVLEHGERLDQHEVLVDHADAGRDRVLRAAGSPSACRRPGSRRCRPGRSRRGCSSASTCRRRSRRRCRGSCRPGRRGRCAGWRGRRRSACRCRAARPPGAAARRQSRPRWHAGGRGAHCS